MPSLARPHEASAAARSILVVKTSSLGDIVHALPAITDLSRARPELTLDWLVEEAFSEIPRLHPAVRHAVPCAIRRWRRRLLAPETRREITALRRAVREAGYGAVLDLQGLLKSAWLSSLAKVPVHGYDRPSAREPLAGLAYAHRHAVPRGLHAVERNRRLAAAAFGYALQGAPDYGLEVKASPGKQPYVVCLHATSRADKCWPEQHWSTLVKSLGREGLRCLLPWGSNAERKRAEAIASSSPQAQVLPALSLTELARLLAGARATIGVDTGLVHLAAAVGCPVLALYLASDPGLTGACAGRAPAVNLGGPRVTPKVSEVLGQLHPLLAAPPQA